MSEARTKAEAAQEVHKAREVEVAQKAREARAAQEAAQARQKPDHGSFLTQWEFCNDVMHLHTCSLKRTLNRMQMKWMTLMTLQLMSTKETETRNRTKPPGHGPTSGTTSKLGRYHVLALS